MERIVSGMKITHFGFEARCACEACVFGRGEHSCGRATRLDVLFGPALTQEEARGADETLISCGREPVNRSKRCLS